MSAKDPRGRKPIYPFGTMKIGDVEVVAGSYDRVAPARSMWQKRNGGTFRCKTVEGGVRIVRIA